MPSGVGDEIAVVTDFDLCFLVSFVVRDEGGEVETRSETGGTGETGRSGGTSVCGIENS